MQVKFRGSPHMKHFIGKTTSECHSIISIVSIGVPRLEHLESSEIAKSISLKQRQEPEESIKRATDEINQAYYRICCLYHLP